MKIKITLIIFSLFVSASTAFGDNTGCCIKDTKLTTISEGNCVRNAEKTSCLDPSSFFLEGDLECKGGIAASYCPQKSSESELGCCVKNINDTSQYGTSNCQSNTKRSECSGSNSLFEVTQVDCSKNTSVSAYCTAAPTNPTTPPKEENPTTGTPQPETPQPTTPKGQTETGIVPCGHSAPCTLCHLIVGIHNLITWGRNILLVLATLGIVVAGIMYIMAGTVTSAEKAKGALYNALIGFAVIWAAWLIVNTVMLLISAKEDLGVGKTNWWTFTCNTVSTATGTQTGQGGTTAAPPGTNECKPTGNGCGGLGGNTNGCEYTSPELAAKLSCLQSSGAKIVSITLNAHSDWCEKCVFLYTSESYCKHSENSCHFGGRNCKGTSQGADLNPSDAVAQAAVKCGFDTVIWKGKELISGKSASDHGDHVHVSVNNKKCGCDYQK